MYVKFCFHRKAFKHYYKHYNPRASVLIAKKLIAGS